MKALRWHARRDLRLEEINEPTPGDAEVLIEVGACGICGSDLLEWIAGPVDIKGTPRILGHEVFGTVVDRGSAVTDLHPGARVALEGEGRCGECWQCQAGNYNLCQKAIYLGFGYDGGLARYVTAPAVQAIPVPDDVSDDIAALVEPLAVGTHAVARGEVGPGLRVAVMGAGPVGLGAIAAAKIAGAEEIVSVDPSAARGELASLLGATAVINPSLEDTVQAGRKLTPDDRGFDVVIELSGRADALVAAIGMAQKGGTVVTVGMHPAPVTLDINTVTHRQISIRGSLGYLREYPKTFAMMAARESDIRKIITSRIPLESVIEEGFAALERDKETNVKIHVNP